MTALGPGPRRALVALAEAGGEARSASVWQAGAALSPPALRSLESAGLARRAGGGRWRLTAAGRRQAGMETETRTAADGGEEEKR